MTYLTPNVERQRPRSAGDLTPLGTRIDASGGWWDAGDYLKFVHAASYTEARAAHRRARLPGPDGRRRRRRSDFTAEARFGARLAPADVGRPARGRSTTRSGSATGTTKTVSDHDIWRLPQDDDTYGGTRPALPLHPQPAGVPRRAARLADQPEPGRPRRRRARALLPGVPDDRDPAFATPVPAAGRAHLRPRRHEPDGQLIDRDPVQLLSRDRVAGRPRAGRRPSCTSRSPPAACRPACRTPTRAFYLGRAAHVGARLHHRAERRRRHAEPLRRERARATTSCTRAIAQAANPAGLAVTQAGCSPT